MGQCFSPTSRRKQSVHDAYIRTPERNPPFRKLPLHTHSILKDYEITQKVIGTGVTGPIRLIKRRCNAERCCLKILLDDRTARHEVELQFLACQHPNVARVVDVYENLFRDARCLFVVAEYMSGGQLLEIIKTGQVRISERDVLRIVRDLGSAIAYIHSLGIVHRDIKLENVMYSNKGMLKLTDFGLALMEKEQPKATLSTSYHPPSEVGQPKCSKKPCDMWSLGIIMYFLLCGYPPYFSIQEDDFSEFTQQKIVTGEYLFPADQWDKQNQQSEGF
uniref:non-specific serine/threonine protein kinase n=1 Tax=Parascaris univalens TaxID=6257 RepID=A0A915BJX2_PARUN